MPPHRSLSPRRCPYLDDYAFLIAGLPDLYETTWDPGRLRAAIELQDVLDRHYLDAERGGYYLTPDDHELLLAREKPAYDGSEPSGNSVAGLNLLRLYALTTDDRYRASADRLLRAFSGVLDSRPWQLAEMLLALDFQIGPVREVVLVTPRDRDGAGPFLEALRGRFIPSKVVVVAAEGADLNSQSAVVPLLTGKVARKGRATAYVCERAVCKLPTTDVEVFLRQLEERPEQE